VISEQGQEKTKLIEHKLLERLEPEVIEARRLICGDAYAFQGDERHIIFLSMVAAPNERIGALATDSARQRFNVAASRAQDQLWLSHSATLDVLSPSCMRHRLLAYMLHPERQATDEAEQRFESRLERHVYALVTGRGFHVRTQVCVGDPTNHRYRIDLVIEGMQGRLAVECDGDEWHGPDRYEQDMARQRDLERAGWRFVRIRGGDFYRDRTKALEPLWAELDRLGIKPGGIDHGVERHDAGVAAAGPENQDTDFTWAEFVRRNNDELVANWGNLVNRAVSFAARNIGSVPPPGTLTEPDLAILDSTEPASVVPSFASPPAPWQWIETGRRAISPSDAVASVTAASTSPPTRPP